MVIVFILGTKHYGDKTEKKGVQPGDMPFYKIVLFILLPSAVFGVIGWLLKGVQSDINLDSVIFLVRIVQMPLFLLVFP